MLLYEELDTAFKAYLAGAKARLAGEPRPLADRTRSDLASGLARATIEKLKADGRAVNAALSRELSIEAAARCVAAFERVANIRMGGGGPENAVPGAYVWDGPAAGTYDISKGCLTSLAYAYAYAYPANMATARAVTRRAAELAPPIGRTFSDRIVPVGNGLFDRDAKRLLPFSPDLVFLEKIPVDYDPDIQNPVLRDGRTGIRWDIEEWMRIVAGGQETVDALWRVMGASLLTKLPGRRVAWVYPVCAHTAASLVGDLVRALHQISPCHNVLLRQLRNGPYPLEFFPTSVVLSEQKDAAWAKSHPAEFLPSIQNEVFTIRSKGRVPLYDMEFHGLLLQIFDQRPLPPLEALALSERVLLVPILRKPSNREWDYLLSSRIRDGAVLQYTLRRALDAIDGLDDPLA